MRRTEARELLMQLLFQMDAQRDFSAEGTAKFIEENMSGSSQLDYFDKVLSTFIDNREKIDEAIENSSVSWKMARMGKVDLAVLRLCLAELLCEDKEDIPPSAAINEAVRLAKKYSDEDSGKFVNGILGRVYRDGFGG